MNGVFLLTRSANSNLIQLRRNVRSYVLLSVDWLDYLWLERVTSGRKAGLYIVLTWAVYSSHVGRCWGQGGW